MASSHAFEDTASGFPERTALLNSSAVIPPGLSHRVISLLRTRDNSHNLSQKLTPVQKGGMSMQEYLKVPQAAELLGISPKAAWQHIYRGEIPFRRWGRRILGRGEKTERVDAFYEVRDVTK